LFLAQVSCHFSFLKSSHSDSEKPFILATNSNAAIHILYIIIFVDCIFCKIVDKKIPCYKVGENKNALAFLDVSPISNGHTIVIPKKHFENFTATPDNVLKDVMSLAKKVCKILDKKLKPSGYNFLSNQNKIAGQCVFHFHLHVIPKYTEGEGYELKCNKPTTTPVKDIYDKI